MPSNKYPLLIEKFYKIHKQATIYIVGTGPSMRIFPLDFLKDKITIGLNQTYKYFNPTYSLTVHPYLIPYNRNEWNTKWLTKSKMVCEGWIKHKKLENHKYFYIFNNNNNPEDFLYFKDLKNFTLYVGRGIQTGAIHLACLMGAKYIVLIGCDMCSLDNEHHGHKQHTEFHGHSPNNVYNEYYYYTVKCRELAKKLFNAEVITLTPFIGLKNIDEDYKHIKKVNKISNLSAPKNIEIHERKGSIITDFI